MNEACLSWSRTAFRQLHGLDAAEPVPLPEAGWLKDARRHRIVGLRAAVPAGQTDVPDGWYRPLCGQTLRSTRLSAEAGRIYSALQYSVEGLRLVKGPALAAQAWSDNGLRDYDDLDFRCARQSLNALLDGLLRLGYRPEQEPLRMRHLWHFGWGISFGHPDGFHVEVNHYMFPPHYPWPEQLTWDVPDAWQLVSLDGQEILCPAPAMHLLLSCLHAVWHGWERLGWIVDIAGLLVRHPGCREEAQRLAQGSPFSLRALQCGCAVAASLFGPLPAADGDGVPADEEVCRARQLLTRTAPGIAPALRRALHRRLMTRRETLISDFRRLITPGDSEFRRFSLPEPLRGLYWILRPIRILRTKTARR